MELFLHPWYMIAGGALVSSPIIIHLINRMRFKRVRWAAMEFLLKSQKRNRRKLIIEQLILLLLRILLVLLAAFLVARFVGAAINRGQGTAHVVVVDDTLSMADRWKENGQERNCFDVAREQMQQLVRHAAEAGTQDMQVLFLSDLDNVAWQQRLGPSSVEDIGKFMKNHQPTVLHVPPVEGLKKARDLLNASPHGQKVLHLVGDFRDVDWGSGADADELAKEIARLTEAGVNVSLLDCAHPYRSETRGATLNHENLAILDFRPEARMVAIGVDVDFHVTLLNSSGREKKPFLKVLVDGEEDLRGSQQLEAVPAGRTRDYKFTLSFNKKKDGPEFVQVSVQVAVEETGLQADHVRDVVIEVRKKVPVLLVDGRGPASVKEERSDSYHIDNAFQSSRAFEAIPKTLDELEAMDLSDYPTIWLVNVPEIRSDKLIGKLQDYVERGGSIAFFLGDKINPKFYNEVLHKQHDGLFPMMIADRPTEPLTEDEKKDRKQKDEQPKILFPDPLHPVVKEGLAPYSPSFRFLMIDRYWPAQPRGQWVADARDEKQNQNIILMPNRRSIDDYKSRAQELGNKALELTKELAEQDKDYQKFVPVVEAHRRAIINALTTPYLFNLKVAIDRLLNDPGVENDPNRPKMEELWRQGRMRTLALQLREFMRTVEQGDPLLVGRKYGHFGGRVVAFTSSAGTGYNWNEWGGGNPVSWSYPAFIMDLQRWLTSQGEEYNRLVTPKDVNIAFNLDPARYQSEMKVEFRPQAELKPAAKEGGEGEAAQPKELKRVVQKVKLTLKNDLLTWTFTDARQPGVYFFEVQPLKPGAEPEVRAYAFNVDAVAESNLQRTPRDKLEPRTEAKSLRAGKVRLLSPGDSFEAFRNREPDVSESPWLYLLFLIILVAEQAMAVHLSFHLKGGEGAHPADQASVAPPAAAA
jgi:hypothetical protein